MQRLVALIAIIFAFASLAGTSVAHAHRYVSMPMVVLNHVDAQNVPIPVMVKVQKGEIDLGSGIVMPCGPHHAIPTVVPCLPAVPPQAAPVRLVDAQGPEGFGQPLLRPPKAG